MENLLTDKIELCRAPTNQSFDGSTVSFDGFRKPWDRTVQAWLLNSATEEAWLERLWKLHSEPTRHYHTTVHLHEMFEYWDALADGLDLTPEQKATITMSIYFHDAIYNPHSSTNEEDSEKLWQEFCINAPSIPKEVVSHVSHYILATKTHQVSPEKNGPLLSLFLDLDLAVLAKQPAAYMAYAALIRREYHFVPVDTYCAKRAEILQAMADQPHLFGSPAFLAWEERARQNLKREVELLRQGKIPE